MVVDVVVEVPIHSWLLVVVLGLVELELEEEEVDNGVVTTAGASVVTRVVPELELELGGNELDPEVHWSSSCCCWEEE